MDMKKHPLKNGMILIAFGVCLYTLLQHLSDFSQAVSTVMAIVNPIVLGLAIAFVLNVLMTPIERLFGLIPPLKKKPGILRSLSVLTTYLLGFAFIALVILVIAPKLGEAVSLLTAALSQYSGNLTETFTTVLSNFGATPEMIATAQSYVKQTTDQLLDLVKNSFGAIANFALGTVMTTFATIVDVVFSLIMSIYVLSEKERIARFLRRLSARLLKPVHYNRLIDLSSLTFRTFTSFIRGQLLEAMILGVMCFIGMLIFGFPHAAAVSLLVGVTALIPIFGAWIGGITAAFLVAMVDPFKGLMMIVFFLVLQQVEGNLIYPRVVGSTIGLPGLLVLAAVIVGQGFFGVTGILIAVPLTAVGYRLIKDYLRKTPAKQEPQEAK